MPSGHRQEHRGRRSQPGRRRRHRSRTRGCDHRLRRCRSGHCAGSGVDSRTICMRNLRSVWPTSFVTSAGIAVDFERAQIGIGLGLSLGKAGAWIVDGIGAGRSQARQLDKWRWIGSIRRYIVDVGQGVDGRQQADRPEQDGNAQHDRNRGTAGSAIALAPDQGQRENREQYRQLPRRRKRAQTG